MSTSQISATLPPTGERREPRWSESRSARKFHVGEGLEKRYFQGTMCEMRIKLANSQTKEELLILSVSTFLFLFLNTSFNFIL